MSGKGHIGSGGRRPQEKKSGATPTNYGTTPPPIDPGWKGGMSPEMLTNQTHPRPTPKPLVTGFEKE